MAANILRMQAYTATDVQSSDALWSVYLVGRDREQVAADLFDIDADLTGRLDRVSVKPDLSALFSQV